MECCITKARKPDAMIKICFANNLEANNQLREVKPQNKHIFFTDDSLGKAASIVLFRKAKKADAMIKICFANNLEANNQLRKVKPQNKHIFSTYDSLGDAANIVLLLCGYNRRRSLDKCCLEKTVSYFQFPRARAGPILMSLYGQVIKLKLFPRSLLHELQHHILC